MRVRRRHDAIATAAAVLFVVSVAVAAVSPAVDYALSALLIGAEAYREVRHWRQARAIERDPRLRDRPPTLGGAVNARIVGRSGGGVVVPITRLGTGQAPVPEGMVAHVSATEPVPVTHRPPMPPQHHQSPAWSNFVFGALFLAPELALLVLVLYWQVVPR
jgi:hypothetical protein